MTRLSLVSFAALAATALAAPTATLQKRSFKAAANGHGRLSPGREINKTFRKYGLDDIWQQIIIIAEGGGSPVYPPWEPPTTQSTEVVANPTSSISIPANQASATPSTTPSATQASEDGEVTATPEENESEYLSPVTVGGQPLNLNFDTGSADLWVFSTELSQSEIGSHAAFDPAKSANWQPLEGAQWNISYGDGSGASGNVGYDVVDVGGSTVQKQCVEIATDVSSEFVQDANSDGLLGLAFSNINTVLPVPQKTFFENVMDQLSAPVFTADLEETDGTGTYEFGVIDQAKYQGEIHYVPVDKSEGFWKIDTPNFQIGDEKHSCTECWGFADTGTSLLYLNRDLVADYYAKVPSASYGSPGGYSYDCSETLPDVSILFGDYPATIKGADLTYAPNGDGTCFGGLQSLDTPCSQGGGCPSASKMQIIGDVFLKQFFAVFDGGNLQFGVAEKA